MGHGVGQYYLRSTYQMYLENKIQNLQTEGADAKQRLKAEAATATELRQGRGMADEAAEAERHRHAGELAAVKQRLADVERLAIQAQDAKAAEVAAKAAVAEELRVTKAALAACQLELYAIHTAAGRGIQAAMQAASEHATSS
jgi:hypothetical protein